MIEAWTFLAEDIETEGDLVLPRYESEELARTMALKEAHRTGRPQLLCKVVPVARYRRSSAGGSGAG